MVYQWSYNVSGVDANVAGQIFEEIEKKTGALTKEAVVEEARPESSPLHGCFEWDDNIAAEKYRCEQARLLICNLRVVYEDKTKEEGKLITRAYVSTSEKRSDRAQYMTVEKALSDEKTRLLVLHTAMDELRIFKGKYSTLNELGEVMTAIDHVFENVN